MSDIDTAKLRASAETVMHDNLRRADEWEPGMPFQERTVPVQASTLLALLGRIDELEEVAADRFRPER